MSITIEAPRSFGGRLKSLREGAGFTQEELATIAGLSVHAISALERGQRRRPHPETVRALAAAFDLSSGDRDAFVRISRAPATNEDIERSDAPPLPHALTPLVGRERDLRTLSGWLADSSARLITLVGTGGVGKTRLALEVARQTADAGTMRVVFVTLASITNPAFVGSAIAEAFGAIDVRPVDLPRRVRAACGGRPTLLVLDNCEHVLDAVPLIANMMRVAESLRVIATSRAPLRIGGEREYVVGPLAITPNRIESNVVASALAPAVRLFVERVHDFDSEFLLTARNAPIIEAICRRLDALPLAIELAAPWLKVLPVEDVLRRLERDVLAPTIVRRDLPERQRTMNATVVWSYDLLPAEEQWTFRRVGVLPSSFSIEAAAAVRCRTGTQPAELGETQHVVAGLMDRSLLVCVEGSCRSRPRYRMLETVRAYAAAALSTSGERDRAMDGLAQYCLAAATTAGGNLVGHAQGEWLDHVRDDHEIFRHALAWLIEHDRHAEACEIAWQLLFFWLIRGHSAEGLLWYDQIARVETLPGDVRAKALAGAGVMLYAQGQLDRARRACELSAILSEGAKTLTAAVAENMIGHVELADGNSAAARNRFAGAARRFEELGVAWGLGNATAGMAGSSLAAGDLGAADHYLADATEVLSAAGPWFSQIVLYFRALAAVRRNRPDAAIAFVRESLARIHVLHDKFALVYALVPLAAAAQLSGDTAWAARILGTRDAVTERTGAVAAGRSGPDLQDGLEREVQTKLGQTRWAREYEAGRNCSLESLLRDIDDHCHRATSAVARATTQSHASASPVRA